MATAVKFYELRTSSDAAPYVKLGGGIWPCGCVTVKVYTLRAPQGGHVIHTYEPGFPVYIFRAF